MIKDKTYLYRGQEARLLKSIKIGDEMRAIISVNGNLEVVFKRGLTPWKESPWEVRKAELNKELEDLEKKTKRARDKEVNILANKAVKELRSRMKLKIAFGDPSAEDSAMLLKLLEVMGGIIKEEIKKD